MDALLPLRRADTGIAGFERFWHRSQVQGITRADAHSSVEVQGVFRVEVGVGTFGVIVELEMAEQGYCREDVLDVERFAPAGVSDDDVRRVAVFPQLEQFSGDGLAVEHALFEAAQVVVCGGSNLASRFVDDGVADFWVARGVRLAEGDDVVLRGAGKLRSQMCGEVAELPREVLVDEEDVHPIARSRRR